MFIIYIGAVVCDTEVQSCYFQSDWYYEPDLMRMIGRGGHPDQSLCLQTEAKTFEKTSPGSLYYWNVY